jgi:hypothetical protein
VPNVRHINKYNLVFGTRVVKYDTPKILIFRIVIFRSITSIIQYVVCDTGFFGRCIGIGRLVWHYSWKIYGNKIGLCRLNLCLWFHNLKCPDRELYNTKEHN